MTRHRAPIDVAFASLCELLDADPAARRRAAGEPVWDAERRLLDLRRRVQGLPRRDADGLLARAVANLAGSGRAAFLDAADSIEPSELGAGAWREVTPRVWRAPAALAPEDVAGSSLLAGLGNYAIYARPEPLPNGLPAGLPWWGPRADAASAAAILRALRAAGVEAAVVVHPDASAWVAAVPAGCSETSTA